MGQAKGFPDLATRRFLSVVQTIRPDLALFALVDFDPDGIAILRTYKYGSQRLYHEENVTAPRLQWLGILSDDISPNGHTSSGGTDTSQSSQSQASQGLSSQDSATYSCDGE
jgi:meiotic recombination protein SPO11